MHPGCLLTIPTTDTCCVCLRVCYLNSDHQIIRTFLLQQDLCQPNHEEGHQSCHDMGSSVEYWKHHANLPHLSALRNIV